MMEYEVQTSRLEATSLPGVLLVKTCNSIVTYLKAEAVVAMEPATSGRSWYLIVSGGARYQVFNEHPALLTLLGWVR